MEKNDNWNLIKDIFEKPFYKQTLRDRAILCNSIFFYESNDSDNEFQTFIGTSFAEYSSNYLLELLENKRTKKEIIEYYEDCFPTTNLDVKKLLEIELPIFEKKNEITGREFIREYWKFQEKLYYTKER